VNQEVDQLVIQLFSQLPAAVLLPTQFHFPLLHNPLPTTHHPPHIATQLHSYAAQQTTNVGHRDRLPAALLEAAVAVPALREPRVPDLLLVARDRVRVAAGVSGGGAGEEGGLVGAGGG
jgi:hypothetical protein